jgi:hypothetical protein
MTPGDWVLVAFAATLTQAAIFAVLYGKLWQRWHELQAEWEDDLDYYARGRHRAGAPGVPLDVPEPATLAGEALTLTGLPPDVEALEESVREAWEAWLDAIAHDYRRYQRDNHDHG